jgi:hypothetical protein
MLSRLTIAGRIVAIVLALACMAAATTWVSAQTQAPAQAPT